MRLLALAALAVMLGTHAALAATAPPLPASAKKVSGAAILSLYDGKTYAFKSYTFFGIATGSVSYDFKAHTNHGTYSLGSHHGTFNGTIRIAGDRLCYTSGHQAEKCNDIYQDGRDLYNVSPSGIVDSVNLPPGG